MRLEYRIAAFGELGSRLHSIEQTEKVILFQNAGSKNPWFTPSQIDLALAGIGQFLQKDKIRQWIKGYNLDAIGPKKVGVVMAGNIPMVGLHDMLSVLISGHHLVAKLSTQDSVLMNFLIDRLIDIEPRFKTRIFQTERMNAVDALIATGSDNTAHHFEYYFRNIPHIIRRNRSSCAILLGDEQTDQLGELGKDVFSFFGLGCRSVSKLFIPQDFDLTRLLRPWSPFETMTDHHKYANNYDYNKSIYLVGRTPFYDTGYVLLTEHPSVVSPISVVYYERYHDREALEQKLTVAAAKIQCTVSANGWYPGSVPFGKAQFPELWDYADGVNTLDFLKG